MGGIPWDSALRAGTRQLTGRPELRRALPAWLKLSQFAAARPVVPSR
jgi:hypothetical protein